jgi:hypothetical protein
MVGHLTLDQAVGVRVPAPQPGITRRREGRSIDRPSPFSATSLRDIEKGFIDVFGVMSGIDRALDDK